MNGLHNGSLSGGDEVRDLLARWIQRILAELRMQPVGQKIVIQDEGNWTAFQIIAESHMSLHSKPTGEVWVDIFSCRNFDVGEATRITVAMLGITGWNSQLIEDRIPGSEGKT